MKVFWQITNSNLLFSWIITFVQAGQRYHMMVTYQLINMYTNHNPFKENLLLHQLLHTLLLVRALSPPTQPPPVPAYLLEPMVALKVITQCSVGTLLLSIVPLLYQQHVCWISSKQLLQTMNTKHNSIILCYYKQFIFWLHDWTMAADCFKLAMQH